MLPVIERARSPLYVIRWPKGVSAADVEGHFDEVRDLLGLGLGRAVFVVDLRAFEVSTASLRSLAAARIKELMQGGHVVGVAHVVTSPLVHGVMTAVYWLSPPPFPTPFFEGMDEALRWAERLLHADAQRTA